MNFCLNTGIIWSSSLTETAEVDTYLDPAKYIIQIWSIEDVPIINELLIKGFNVIFSNSDAWYLDCGMGAWVGEGNNWCSPYKGWQLIYDNNPQALVSDPAYHNQIIGGEAALWTEQADGLIIDSRVTISINNLSN